MATIAGLSDDEMERARIRREPATRPFRAPPWTRELDALAIQRAVRTQDLLGDGDSILLGGRLGAAAYVSALVYIDRNSGSIVKDAFIAGVPVDELVENMRRVTGDDADVIVRELDLADARAKIESAIKVGAMTVPHAQSLGPRVSPRCLRR